MSIRFVVRHARDWPFDTPGVAVVDARTYLDDAADAHDRVINFCKSYRYQGRGYYVSLLAEARGQQPMPDVRTIEDLHHSRLLRLLTEQLDDTIREALAGVHGQSVELYACFGRDPSGEHPMLARALFDCLRLPLLRARFERDGGANGPVRIDRRRGWRLAEVRALGPTEVLAAHRTFMAEAAAAWVRASLPPAAAPRPPAARPPAIAILYDPGGEDSPSNPAAIERFRQAADTLGMRCETLSRRDIERLGEFDALFVRDTTRVNHYTYRFARRAAALGLVTIDDPDSILKCTNKVYLHELMSRHGVPTPRTLMVHKGNVDRIVPALGLPCILKRPDSAFSLGVEKATTSDELAATVARFLQKSELIVAQEFLPTEFDWRVGVLDGRALFACKYFMAPGHWQVIKRTPAGIEPVPADRGTQARHTAGPERLATRGRVADADRIEGSTLACSIGETPEQVIEVAVRAAALIGDGLYGVDIKQVGGRCCVIEINDNPNVDAGNEDGVLGEALYREVMGVFLRRVRARQAAVRVDAGAGAGAGTGTGAGAGADADATAGAGPGGRAARAS